jgi:RNA polymerase sigma factor (sigma-70 family)
MAQIAEFDRLMAEVAAGSEEAVWQLAETYTPHIIRAVRYSLSPTLRQKLDSMDFAQTLWASLLLRPGELVRLKTPQQLIGYLVNATRNKVCDKTRHLHTRKHDVRREQSLDQASVRRRPRAERNNEVFARDPSPSAIASVRDQWKYVLANTSKRDREILRLRREGQSFEAIGTILDINEQTARRAMHRLLKLFAN